MKECEDCGDECARRTKCPLCGLLVCPWCRGHVHNETVQHAKTVAAGKE
jgi:hypothetical protein